MSTAKILELPAASRKSDGLPRKLILFQIAQQRYAVAMDCVLEIVSLCALVKPPGCPAVVEGFLNLSGALVPVLRLDRLLGLAAGIQHVYTPLVIVRSSGTTLALLVDRVTGIAVVETERIVPIAQGSTVNDCTSGLATVDGQTVIVLDADRLLLKQERVRLNQIQQQARQRIDQLEVTSPCH